MPPARSASARRAAVLLVVLVAHVVLGWGLRQLGVWRDRGAPAPRDAPLQVRVFAPPPQARPDERLLVPALPLPALPPPLAVPSATVEPPAVQWLAAPAESVPPAPAPAAAPARPLVLDLPRGAAAPRRPPALDDPRANSRPPTLESRIAGATGGDVDTGGAWTEEPLAGGLMRIRRGRECWIVAPNRDRQLDPFNQSAIDKPRSARPC